jgi:alpha-L-fucosidase 2
VILSGKNEMFLSGTHVLWLKAPARRWLDALPLGNGHFGAMVYGGVNRERLWLTDVTCWSGEAWDGPMHRGAEALPEIRKALFERDYPKAHELVKRLEPTAESNARIGTRAPTGDLWIDFQPRVDACNDYRRELDLESGVALVRFVVDGVMFRRHYLTSNPDKVLVVRQGADRPGRVTFDVRASQFKGFTSRPEVRVEGGDLVLTSRALEPRFTKVEAGVRFQIRVRILHEGGEAVAGEDSVGVKGADAATILATVTTDFAGGDIAAAAKGRLDAAAGKGFERLREDHVADVRPLFRRVEFDLGRVPGREALATDERLAAFKQSFMDPGLLALFFQYGRYLTIAGSRADSPLPLPLQGLWSDGISVWSDDYHLDINTQQNYWVAEVGNLAECHLPLFDYIERLRVRGRAAARGTWGADGWCAHITANAWGDSPFLHHGGPTMAIWMASHLWDHYAFSGDAAFLRDRAYPVLKECAEFFLQTLVADPAKGWLVTAPAYSPENRFKDPKTGTDVYYTAGNTGDVQLIGELFRMCTEASLALGVDAPFRKRVEEAARRLPPLAELVSKKDGRLMEWFEEEYDTEYSRRNRHAHHLTGLFPLEALTPQRRPDLARAVQIAVDDRQDRQGREDTEWTRGNHMHWSARLGDGDRAYSHLPMLLKAWVEGGSLLTVSWGNIFCLDGNTAATSGMAEMLLQSHSGEVSLLPALPKKWPDGRVRGLRARGGYEVAMEWKDRRIVSAELVPSRAGKLRLRVPHPVRLSTDAGPVAAEARERGLLVEVAVEAGRTIKVAPAE